MNRRETINIIYHYIVENWNMEESANAEGYNTSDASQMFQELGFNNDRRKGWGGGKDKGRYSPAATSRYGVTVDWDDIADWYDNCDYPFEEYFQEMVENSRQQAQQRARQQADRAEEERRRREEERQWQEQEARREREDARRREEEARRRAEEERRRQAEEAAERARREREEARRREEEARKRAEEARRKAALDAARSSGQHKELMQQAYDALERGDYTTAHRLTDRAWEIQPMVGLQELYARCYLAEGDKDTAADWAIDYMNDCEEGSRSYLEGMDLLLAAGGWSHSGRVDQRPAMFRALRSSVKKHDFSWLSDAGMKEFAVMIIANIDNPILHGTGLSPEELRVFCEEVDILLGYERLPNDIRLVLAKALTEHGLYEQGLQVLHYVDTGERSYDSLRNRYYPYLGRCYYELGDRDSALWAWLGGSDHLNAPLDFLFPTGCDADLAELCSDGSHPEIMDELGRAQAFRQGKMPASVYYGRWWKNWQSVLNHYGGDFI